MTIDLQTTIENMEAAGMTADDIVRALRCLTVASSEPVRTARQERNARYYANKSSEKRLKASEQDASSSPNKDFPHTPLENNPNNSAPIPPKGPPFPQQAEFEVWYRGYPHKVQRGAAERAFVKARKVASLDVLVDGLARYAAKQDDRPWQNPATWLNGKGWLDEPARPTARDGPQPRRSNDLSDAFGFLDHQGPRNDFIDTAPVEGSVLYLPAAAR